MGLLKEKRSRIQAKAGFAPCCLLAMIKKLEVDKEILAEQDELDRITE
jgi:hypothetical protein